MTTSLDKTVYTASVTVTGGRAEGHAISDDGFIDVQLRRPKEMGGPGEATNPEQLFAAGYAACFQAALGVVSQRRHIDTAESTVTCRVAFGPVGQAFGLAVDLAAAVPGIAAETERELIEEAHKICPYSNATRDNIEVRLHSGREGSAAG